MTAGPVSLRQLTQTDILSSISRQFKESQQSNTLIATQIGAYCAHWSLVTTQVPNFNNILDKTALNPLR